MLSGNGSSSFPSSVIRSMPALSPDLGRCAPGAPAYPETATNSYNIHEDHMSIFAKSRLSALYLLFLIFLAFCLVTRTVLLCKALPGLETSPLLLAKIYGCGFFFDCVTFSYLSVPFVIYAIVAPDRVFNCRPVAWVVCF